MPQLHQVYRSQSGVIARNAQRRSGSGARGRQRLGHISKQGNTLLRFLMVEAAQVTVRSDPAWRRKYLHQALRRGRKIAKVAMARRLAVRLYWMA
ncbi:MAG: transposase [Candidatus Sulfotelmatobacter sp.]